MLGYVFKMDIDKEIYKLLKLLSSDELSEDEALSDDVPQDNDVGVWSSDIVRGKANPIDQNSKWESGIVRGKANKLK